MRRLWRWKSLGAVAGAVRSSASPDAPGIGQRVAALPRMVKAIRSGEYTGADLSTIGLMVFATGYVVSPVDLIPEALFLLAGLADDALVIGWLAITLVRVTDDFLEWEAMRAAVPADVIR